MKTIPNDLQNLPKRSLKLPLKTWELLIKHPEFPVIWGKLQRPFRDVFKVLKSF